jgi:hypothetical protein
VIAAAMEISGEREIVVIGSQAILGSVEEPPEVLLESMEVDVYPLGAPEKAIEIETVLGEGSSFQGLYGYYAHGVGPETMKGPVGWPDRLIRVKVPPRIERIEELPGGPELQEGIREMLEGIAAQLAREPE